MKRESLAFLWEVLRTIAAILLIAWLVRSFVVQPFYVVGSSMEPNYHHGEYLLVDELSYQFRDPNRGEVIVLEFPRDPSKDYIKRVIGLPGEAVRISGGVVHINGQRLAESYVRGLPTESETEVTLGDDEYFVLGDNRLPSASSDSRDWGTVPRANIVGRAWVKMWPPADFGLAAPPDYQFSR